MVGEVFTGNGIGHCDKGTYASCVLQRRRLLYEKRLNRVTPSAAACWH